LRRLAQENPMHLRSSLLPSAFAAAALVAACSGKSSPPSGPAQVSTGQAITPIASPGSTFQTLNPGLKDFPGFVAGQPISEAISPDRKTLLVLTSGYNNNYDNFGNVLVADSNEYVFVFDVSVNPPLQKQVLQVPNTYAGIAFAPDGSKFYVSGGGDDQLHVFAQASGAWAEASGSPIALGHTSANGLAQGPLATGVGATADGKRAVVANRYNDSITVVDLVGNKVAAELDLRPGKSGGVSGTAGGEYPNSVAIVGSSTVYVSSERDREIVVVDISGATPAVKTRLSVKGNPNKMTLNKAQTTLYVACDNSDLISVIDTTSNQVAGSISTVAPAGVLTATQYSGASPNGLALSPDEATLYVTNRGTNSVAVISVSAAAVIGLIPTAWYPSDVAVGQGGAMLYVVNTKSMPGPNGGNCLGYQTVPCPVKSTPVAFAPNQYVENLNKGGFAAIPAPNAAVLAMLTAQVAKNNSFNFSPSATDASTMAALRSNIKHVVYVVKENRTYDQVLGDLGVGNGNPSLAEFPQATTPSQHALAKAFVTLDNFYDAGEVSGNGWPWSTAARESDASAKMLPVNYACSPAGGAACNKGRGGSYDWEGANRNINVGLAGNARMSADPITPTDPELLPGTGNIAAPDGPGGQVQQGYLWNAALRAGLTVRNYGFFIDLTRYNLANAPAPANSYYIKLDRTPFANSYVQAYVANPDLVGLTDPYFRGFDDAYPDFYREQEWEREFNGYVAGNNLPALSLVRLMNDHTGSYKSAIDGVNTPEIQVADNDYAVGRLIQAVATSPYANNTLVFVIEDDAQDGPDHVDAHRSIAFVAGPYVKQGAVVSTRYSTVNVLRTITDVLGLDHLGIFDANAAPMTDVFDLGRTSWTFKASASGLLAGTQLPVPKAAIVAAALQPTHTTLWWSAQTRGMDFSVEDRVDPAVYNQLLWRGLMGDKPYPQRASRGAKQPE
jgi:YVTN family beta-propeller protein